jgi:hypothetical protein
MNPLKLSFSSLLSVKVIHSIPGRTRLHLPFVKHVIRDFPLAENIEVYFVKNGLLKEINFSAHTGNLLIHYDPDSLSDKELVARLNTAFSVLRKEFLRFLLKPREKRRSVMVKLDAHLRQNPIDFYRIETFEVPDEIWS